MDKVIVYENLPSGGAKNLYKSNIKYLKARYKISYVNKDPVPSQVQNIFQYYYSIIKQPFIYKNFDQEAKSGKVLLIFHSWITKSSIVMRKTAKRKIYICHEAPREFYDGDYISKMSIKEKIINLLLLPIKIIDYLNVKKAKNLTIVANSKYSASILKKTYNKESVVIYPGINLHDFQNISEYQNRENQVLCVGAINKLKNQKFLVDCISEIPIKSRPNLVLVGNGFNSSYLKEVKSYAIERKVKLLIYLNASKLQLRKIYLKSKVFTYPSHKEPFGLVILEALACGLPIVANNEGGYIELISNNNGYLLKNFQKKEWARYIQLLMSDSRLWSRFSKINKSHARKYSELLMNKRLVKVIEQNIHLSPSA